MSRQAPLCRQPWPVRPAVRRALLVAALVSTLLACGCGSFFPPGAPSSRLQFTTSAGETHPGTKNTRTTQLVIPRPNAPEELAGDAIVLLFNEREVRQLQGFRWSSSVPLLLQRSLVTAFDSSGAFASVTDDTSGISTRFRVLCDLQQFALIFTGNAEGDTELVPPPVAHVQATFRLLDIVQGQTLATTTIEVKQPAQAKTPVALVKACEQAVEQLLSRIVPWTITKVDEAR